MGFLLVDGNNTFNKINRVGMIWTVQHLLLEVDKYAPNESPKWKRVNARFPALYKALLAEPDAATCGARTRQAVRAAGRRENVYIYVL